MHEGPLAGIRVLDFTHGVAGPYASMLLGDLGADVIRIEPVGGESLRTLSYSDRFHGDPEVGGDYFLALNRNKRSVCLNLREERGAELARGLTDRADVVLESFRPGVMDRLGIGYDALAARNPGLVYGSISGYGVDGPLHALPSNDLALQARAGMLSITGEAGGPPVKLGASVSVLSAGLHLSHAVVAALLRKARTGRGQAVDVSILDATMAMMTNLTVAVLDGDYQVEPMGSSHPGLSPFEAFPTSDGHVVISAGNDRFFANLCDALGLQEMHADPRFADNYARVANRAELSELIAKITLTEPTAHWLAVLADADVPASPVNSVREAFESPQVRHNEMVSETQHPTLGSLHVIGVPYKFSDSRCEVRMPPPRAGEHSREVLGELLALDEQELGDLEQAGVL